MPYRVYCCILLCRGFVCLQFLVCRFDELAFSMVFDLELGGCVLNVCLFRRYCCGLVNSVGVLLLCVYGLVVACVLV